MTQYKFPKLPDQDDYLLNLQNTNYSMRTVYNYARDLCIFAMFMRSQGIRFENLDKKSITIYKGYLRTGDHIRDLNQFREGIAQNAGVIKGGSEEYASNTAKDDDSSSKGSKTNGNDPSALSTPPENRESGSTTPRTAETYLDDVYRKVYGSLGSLQVGRVPHSSNPKAGMGLDARSVNRMLSALRSYLRYRIDFDLETPIPPDSVKLLKADKKEKQVAQLDELTLLIECPTFFEKDEKVGIRNRAMLEILFSTGMRISELVGLDLKHVNLEGKFYIMGKGRKQRFVYLTPRAMLWLDNYLAIRLKFVGQNENSEKNGKNVLSIDSKVVSFGVEKGLKNGSNSDSSNSRETSSLGDGDVSRGVQFTTDDNGNIRYNEGVFKSIDLLISFQKSGYLDKFYSPALFIPFSGGRNKKRGKRLSINHFQEKIADYRRRIGIQVPTSAHSLRHGFATYLAENGASAAAIQILLGHESLNTTTKYLHASDKFAEKQHREMHPLSEK